MFKTIIESIAASIVSILTAIGALIIIIKKRGKK